MVRIAHEAPISFFKQVRGRTDYDYALVHLFEESEEYYELFKTSLKEGREVVLDNSIFELGTAFDSTKFAQWVNTLEPSYYIIPDALEDKDKTISNFDKWMDEYKGNLPGKTIAVVQGKTYGEIVECYKYLVNKVDKIAISFDYSLFNSWTRHLSLPTKYHEWMIGRQMLLARMIDDKVINDKVPHHLLGCGLPQEFKAYRNYTFINSLDTSNPVVAGIKRICYNKEDGLETKPSEKLFTMINMRTTIEQESDIIHNIYWFRKIVNG